MQLYFKSKRLKKACEESASGVQLWGEGIARKVRQRLAEFQAAKDLSYIRAIPAARCHELHQNRKGQLAVSLSGNMRLVFAPCHDPIPTLPDGGLDWGAVTEIVIREVTDYHGE